MEAIKGGQSWPIGTVDDVAWLAGQTEPGLSITVAIPPVFEAYATCYERPGISIQAFEHALVDELTQHTDQQPWWLGYLDTGPFDIVFPNAPKVSLYMDWNYVLVQAGPDQALNWRKGGHIRSGTNGVLPELIFPADRSWLASALWDDSWIDVGGSAALIRALQDNPLINAHPVGPDDEALPPGLTRE